MNNRDPRPIWIPPHVGGPTQEDADALLEREWRRRVEANLVRRGLVQRPKIAEASILLTRQAG